MIRRFILTVILVGMVIPAVATHAASIKLEVDTKGQEHDSIRVHMANIPRDFVFADPPAYAGPGDPVAGSANLRHITIPGLTPGQTYKFIAVLTRGAEFSPGSNVVQQKMPQVVIKLEAATISVIEVKGE